ncbi:MAG TPA: hypothetical protein VJK71_02720 [Gemmatimonadales bacterium]|nr:hypothetical protein [Gemmatimonadales bacterium]
MKFPAGLLPFFLLIPTGALAQVGHDPARSPYRSLRYGQFLGVTSGWFAGSGGPLGVAPHGGASVGLRYDLLATGTVSLGFAASMANLKRMVIDPTLPLEFAASGPVPQRTFFGETILQFNLTGGKSWNRLAPFASAGLGLALAERTPEDGSGFSFRAKLAVTPGIGTRIFLAERLFLRLEARGVFWQVSYPPSYRQNPSTAPNQPPVLAAPAKEWLTNGWLTAGVSYAFRRPF